LPQPVAGLHPDGRLPGQIGHPHPRPAGQSVFGCTFPSLWQICHLYVTKFGIPPVKTGTYMRSVGSQISWRMAMPLPATLQNSQQSGGRAFLIFMADPRTEGLCITRPDLIPQQAAGNGRQPLHTCAWGKSGVLSEHRAVEHRFLRWRRVNLPRFSLHTSEEAVRQRILTWPAAER
jgi:hypothetical protein